jgi:hypothetical protein
MSGFLGMSGAAESIIFLTPSKSAKNEIILDTVPRDNEALELVYKMVSSESGNWDFERTELTSVPPEVESMANKILRFLQKSPGVAFYRNELANSIGENVSQTLLAAISHLLDFQIMDKEQTDKGFYRYSLAEDSLFVQDPASNCQVSQTIKDADSISQSVSRQYMRAVSASWTKDYKKEVFDLLAPDERKRLGVLGTTPEFNVGDTVIKADGTECVVTSVVTQKVTIASCIYLLDDETSVEEVDLSLPVIHLPAVLEKPTMYPIEEDLLADNDDFIISVDAEDVSDEVEDLLDF